MLSQTGSHERHELTQTIQSVLVILGMIQGAVASSILTADAPPSPKSVGGIVLTAICCIAALGFWHRILVPFLVSSSGSTSRYTWYLLCLGTAAGVSGRMLAISLATGLDVDKLLPMSVVGLAVLFAEEVTSEEFEIPVQMPAEDGAMEISIPVRWVEADEQDGEAMQLQTLIDAWKQFDALDLHEALPSDKLEELLRQLTQLSLDIASSLCSVETKSPTEDNHNG